MTMRLLSLLLVLAAGSAHAGIINVFDDRAAFEAASGATSITGPLPNLGNQGIGPITLSGDPSGTPSVTLNSRSGDIYVGTGHSSIQWSTLIPGNEIAISGDENLNVAINLGGPTFSFGFEFHEPSIAKGFGTSPGASSGFGTDTTNTSAAIDSTFTVMLVDTWWAPVGSFTFNAADDVLAFVGVHTDMAFSTVMISESPGGANGENEFFGQFFAGNTAATAVPTPGTAGIIGLGLLALGALRRR